MFDASDLQLNPKEIDPPGSPDKFEAFCCALVREVWKDPTAGRIGRSGQKQNGLDVIARYNMGAEYWGLQSKNKDSLTGSLSRSDVEVEVEKAKGFTPPLKCFYIVTTLPRDQALQAIARDITSKNLSLGLFSVHFWFWEDICEHLLEHRELLYIYWPHLRPGTQTNPSSAPSSIKKGTEKILEDEANLRETNITNSGTGTINIAIGDGGTVTVIPDEKKEIHAKLDIIRNYIDENIPITALRELEQIKKDHWVTADSILKFRILTNIAASESKVGKESDAGKHFIEALQYNPNDEKALCNAATGYLIQEDKEEARKYIQKALMINPASDRAFSLTIYAAPTGAFIEELQKNIPSINLRSAPVSYAIGFVLRARGELEESIPWFRQAADMAPTDIEMSTSLAETLLQTIIDDQSVVFGQQLTEKTRNLLNEIDDIFKKAWNTVSNKEIKVYRTSWLLNRSLVNKLLSNYDIAIRTVDEALELRPDDLSVIKQKAILLFEGGRKDEALVFIKDIIKDTSKPEMVIPAAALLASTSHYDEALEILNSLKNKTDDKKAIAEANRMLVDLLGAVGKFEDARILSDQIMIAEPDNIGYYIDRANLHSAIKDTDGVQKYIDQAKIRANESSSKRELIELANALYKFEKFADASDIFTLVADKNTDSDLTRKLLNSYYRAGKLGEALKVIQALKAGTVSSNKYLVEMESSIYEEIGNWQKAKEICLEFFKKNPEDNEIKIRYAAALLRSSTTEDLKELDELLDSEIDTSDFSFNLWMQLINLYEFRGRVGRAIASAYEARRKFFNMPEAHIQYVGVFFRREKVLDPELNCLEAQENSAILLGDGLSNDWFILEKRKDSDLNKKEINPDHPLFSLLLGKKTGDEIIVQNTGPIPDKRKIQEIKHKFVYALHDSLNNFSSRFPTAGGLWGIKVGTTTDSSEGEAPNGIKLILDQVSKHDNFIHKVEDYYNKGRLTLGAFGKLIGKDVLTVWGGIISSQGSGIQASLGTPQELKESTLLLRRVPPLKLVIDPVSIMTIHGMGMADSLIKIFGRPIVTSSTVDLIRVAIAEKGGLGSDGYMSIAKEGDKFVRNEVTPEQMTKHIQYLDSIAKWIENNCDILPCEPALSIDRDIRKKNEEILGRESYETILLAAQPGNLLYSDDERLRALARNDYNCTPGVWTQLLMMEMREKNVITKEAYAQAILKLLNSKYRHTSVSKEVMVEAAIQASWKIREPLTSVLAKLKEGDADTKSAAAVSAEFLLEIWNKENAMSPEEKENMTSYLAGVLVENRSFTDVLFQLRAELARVFKSNSLEKEEVMSALRAWAKESGITYEI